MHCSRLRANSFQSSVASGSASPSFPLFLSALRSSISARCPMCSSKQTPVPKSALNTVPFADYIHPCTSSFARVNRYCYGSALAARRMYSAWFSRSHDPPLSLVPIHFWCDIPQASGVSSSSSSRNSRFTMYLYILRSPRHTARTLRWAISSTRQLEKLRSLFSLSTAKLRAAHVLVMAGSMEWSWL